MAPGRLLPFLKAGGGLLIIFLIITAMGCGGGSGGYPSEQGDLSVWYVATNGNDEANTCHTPQSPCRTIYWAIAHATNGAVVHIADGTYTEHLFIANKAVQLVGAGPNTILENSASAAGFGYDQGGVITMECPDCYELVRISNMTVQGGKADKGGIIYAADVDLTMTNVQISNGVAGFGGCLYITGTSTVALDHVTIDNCQATDPSGNTEGGGGIFNAGDLTIRDSTISNSATAAFGGGLFNTGKVNLRNVLFEKNSATNWGGGIYNPGPGYYQAGVGELIMVNSTLRENSADIGGGIANNGGSADIGASTFALNSVTNSGGGIANMNYGILSIADVTLSGNSAHQYGGAILNGNPYGTLYGASLTIANNSAYQGGGLYHMVGNLSIVNSIFANNTTENCHWGDLSGGINISSDNTCHFTGAWMYFNLDPMLGPLADNGGPTQTHALLAGSPAIDTGTSWLSPITDQRGISRPLDGNADGVAQEDVGAYEFTMTSMSFEADFPIVTNTPGVGNFTFVQPGNCRSGPGVAYSVITSVPVGTLAPVDGRNPDASWYLLRLSGSLCWVSASIGTFDGAPFALPVREAPPSPTPPPAELPVVCSDYLTSMSCAEHPTECVWLAPRGILPYCAYR